MTSTDSLQPLVLPEQPDDIDPTQLNPLSPEVIHRQATINIGTIGHVAHGKSTVVKAISGVQTVRFKNELERNITIKLGYANAKVPYFGVRAPMGYIFRGDIKLKLHLQPSHVSFVDCPGHDILMATMLNGAAVMDAALLLVAANESCPQPQTSEHLAAIQIMKLKNVIVVQNKIDLVKEEAAIMQKQQILEFVKGTVADGAPIIPISAQLKYNIDVIAEYICKKIPVPPRNFADTPRLIVIRSFDINKPGAEVADLKGGVAGGSILQGVLRVGDEIEVRPGIVSKDGEGRIKCRPIFSRIQSLLAETNDLKYAVPGGLIGVGTKTDPTLCRADRLVGQVLGAVGLLPQIYTELEINYFLLRRLLGVKTDDKKQTKIEKLAKGEILMVNIGSTATGGRVVSVKADLAKILLTSPACTEVNEKIALSRRIDKHWRLVGWGKIKRGVTIGEYYTFAAPSLPSTYKCAVITEPGKPAVIETRPLNPNPPEKHVLIKVKGRAASVIRICSPIKTGTSNDLDGVGFSAYPRVPGHEILGKIVALGPNVAPKFEIGQIVGVGWTYGWDGTCPACQDGLFANCVNTKVTGIHFDGGHAEYVTAPDTSVAVLPDDIDPAKTAPHMCGGVTVFNGLRHTEEVRPGDVVAIAGVGGLGHLGIQFAAKAGYRTVAISGSAAKRDLALKLGAHNYIDSSKQDPVAELKKLGGAKVIVVTAPDHELIRQLVPGLGWRGTVLVVAVVPGESKIDMMTLLNNWGKVTAWAGGSARDWEDTVKFAQLTGVQTMVETFKLEQYQEAYEKMM
ncbi:hypothetical protein HDU93_008225, partial [Gonapodya sp. JEL0774]